MSAPSAAALEPVSLRAWPAGEEAWQGGWLLRASGGYTRRANSVQPLGDPGTPLPEAIERAAAWYRARGLRPIFKWTAESVPAGLEDALAAADWTVEVPTLVMTRDLPAPASAPVAPPLPPGFTHAPEAAAGRDWVDAYARWHGLPEASIPRHLSIVSRIRPAHVAARVLGPDGRLAALGLAVADEGWVGLFDLVTDPALRGRGVGRALVAHLLAWGARQGATATYLQVEELNDGARRLYGHLGFAIAYSYRYRVAPDPSAPRRP